MLPDFPKLKDELSIPLHEYLTIRRDYYLGPFSQSRHIALFEGEGQEFTRVSGETVLSDLWKVDATSQIEQTELETMTLEKVLMKLDIMAKELADKMKKNFYTIMQQTAEESGQVVDGKQQQLSASLILELLEKIDIDFDSNGTPKMPALHIPPESAERLKTVVADADNDIALRTEFEKMIERKREEWRARETSRKLVG